MAGILPPTAAERAPGPATGGRVVHASLARAAWVGEIVRTILEGHSARFVAELRTELAARTTDPDRRPSAGIARALAYLDAKQPRAGPASTMVPCRARAVTSAPPPHGEPGRA
ncbi:hypothetical protein ACIBUR_21705 [Streptomyces anulatus]